MPGYLMHMAMAKNLLMKENIENEGFGYSFFLGSIIADAMSRQNKRNSHFWSDETIEKLMRVPDTDAFLRKYGDRMDEPFIRGYYSHLFLDKMFLEEYWKSEFSFFNERMQPEEGYAKVRYIKVAGHDRIYDREEFLSDKLFYGDYTRMSSDIIKRYDIGLIDKNRLFAILDDGKTVIEEAFDPECRLFLDKMISFVNSKVTDNGNISEDCLILNKEKLYKLIESATSNVYETY